MMTPAVHRMSPLIPPRRLQKIERHRSFFIERPEQETGFELPAGRTYPPYLSFVIQDESTCVGGGEMNRSQREEELVRLQAEFIQNVAHELRTPLTLVRGYVELLADEGLDEETRRRIASAAFSRTLELVERVEAITTLRELEEGEFHPEPVNLMDLAHTVLKMARQKAHRAGVALRLEGPLHPLIVTGDPVRLMEAMEQLVDNAIKFSPAGTQTCVRLYTRASEVHIRVIDQGIGIPPDQLERIFNRFYQVDGSTTRRFGGMGLGLSIVRAIAEAHGGRVWADSRGPGRGSTFTLALPYQPEDIPRA